MHDFQVANTSNQIQVMFCPGDEEADPYEESKKPSYQGGNGEAVGHPTLGTELLKISRIGYYFFEILRTFTSFSTM